MRRRSSFGGAKSMNTVNTVIADGDKIFTPPSSKSIQITNQTTPSLFSLTISTTPTTTSTPPPLPVNSVQPPQVISTKRRNPFGSSSSSQGASKKRKKTKSSPFDMSALKIIMNTPMVLQPQEEEDKENRPHSMNDSKDCHVCHGQRFDSLFFLLYVIQ